MLKKGLVITGFLIESIIFTYLIFILPLTIFPLPDFIAEASFPVVISLLTLSYGLGAGLLYLLKKSPSTPIIPIYISLMLLSINASMTGVNVQDMFSLQSLLCIMGSLLVGTGYVHFEYKLNPLRYLMTKTPDDTVELQQAIRSLKVFDYSLLVGFLLSFILHMLFTTTELYSQIKTGIYLVIFIQFMVLNPIKAKLQNQYLQQEFSPGVSNEKATLDLKSMAKLSFTAFKILLLMASCIFLLSIPPSINPGDFIDGPSFLALMICIPLTFIAFPKRDWLSLYPLHSPFAIRKKLLIVNYLESALLLCLVFNAAVTIDFDTNDFTALGTMISIALIGVLYVIFIKLFIFIPLKTTLHQQLSRETHPAVQQPLNWHQRHRQSLIFCLLILCCLFLFWPYINQDLFIPQTQSLSFTKGEFN